MAGIGLCEFTVNQHWRLEETEASGCSFMLKTLLSILHNVVVNSYFVVLTENVVHLLFKQFVFILDLVCVVKEVKRKAS